MGVRDTHMTTSICVYSAGRIILKPETLCFFAWDLSTRHPSFKVQCPEARPSGTLHYQYAVYPSAPSLNPREAGFLRTSWRLFTIYLTATSTLPDGGAEVCCSVADVHICRTREYQVLVVHCTRCMHHKGRCQHYPELVECALSPFTCAERRDRLRGTKRTARPHTGSAAYAGSARASLILETGIRCFEFEF